MIHRDYKTLMARVKEVQDKINQHLPETEHGTTLKIIFDRLFEEDPKDRGTAKQLLHILALKPSHYEVSIVTTPPAQKSNQRTQTIGPDGPVEARHAFIPANLRYGGCKAEATEKTDGIRFLHTIYSYNFYWYNPLNPEAPTIVKYRYSELLKLHNKFQDKVSHYIDFDAFPVDEGIFPKTKMWRISQEGQAKERAKKFDAMIVYLMKTLTEYVEIPIDFDPMFQNNVSR